MAAPSYTTDLTTIATGDLVVDAGTWDESTDAGWDTGGSMVDDQNLYYNNTECVSAQMTKDSTGTGATGPATIIYVHTAAFTIPSDGAALIHHLWAAPPALNTLANGGIIILAGTSLADLEGWNASGSDFIPAPKGGWANYAINPAIGTPDYTFGAAVTTINAIGVGVAALPQARGNPNACNAVRYGRCTSIYTDGDITNGYATFLGYGIEDALSVNKWSLLDPIEGGYKFQGLMSLGLTATAVDFRDANRNISIANTINVTSAFNAIEVHNAASNVEWTAINISALGTNSRGSFEVVDNATLSKNTCVFTDMGTFVYLSNSTLTNTTYRRCNLITQNAATFSGCTFDKSIATVALDVADTISLVSSSTFTSSGTGYGIEGFTVAGTYNLVDLTFSDYAVSNGTTGNEAIHVSATSGTVTLNISGGTTSPSVHTAGAIVVLVSGAVDVTVKVTTTAGINIQGARVFLPVAVGGGLPFGASVTITSAGTTATVAHNVHGLKTGDKVNIRNATQQEYKGVYIITVTTTDAYTYTFAGSATSPATGTITSTFVVLEGLTNVDGEITMSRTFPSSQPVSGHARQSSTQPFYKTAGIAGVVSTSAGLPVTIQLISDE